MITAFHVCRSWEVALTCADTCADSDVLGPEGPPARPAVPTAPPVPASPCLWPRGGGFVPRGQEEPGALRQVFPEAPRTQRWAVGEPVGLVKEMFTPELRPWHAGVRVAAEQLLVGAGASRWPRLPAASLWAESEVPAPLGLSLGLRWEPVRSETVASPLVPPGRGGGHPPTSMSGHHAILHPQDGGFSEKLEPPVFVD